MAGAVRKSGARGRRALAALALAVLATSGGAARAGDKECVASAERADRLRRSNKLIDARAALQECTRVECPRSIQRECSQGMTEVMSAMPTVVLGARDAKGRDLVDVKVHIDGKLASEMIDGRPIQVDPGVHNFRFETPSAPAFEERVVVRQGEKNRTVTITFATPDEGKDKPPVVVKKPVEEEGSSPVLAYVLGGVGVAALGAALVVDLDASANARELRQTCAPDCDEAEVDAIRQRYLIAGVTAAVGAAALIAGVVLYLTHGGPTHGKRAPRAQAGLHIPASTPGRAATLELRF